MIKRIEKGGEKRFKQLLDRARESRTFLNTYVYRTYQNAQRNRWMSENTTQGRQWKALDPVYKKRKLTKFAEYDGQGRKMLVATGRLYKSVFGDSSEHRKIVDATELRISTSVPYAVYVDEVRTFTKFDREFFRDISKKWREYLQNRKSL